MFFNCALGQKELASQHILLYSCFTQSPKCCRIVVVETLELEPCEPCDSFGRAEQSCHKGI